MPFVFGDPTQTEIEIHVGDVGTVFLVTVYKQDETIFNLASATSLEIRFIAPDREVVDKTALLFTSGTDGKMYYTLDDGDIYIAGTWKYQGIIEFASGTWHTNVVEFTVYPNIPDPS